MSNQVIDAIKKVLTEGTLLQNEPMSRHTSFRIGGPALGYVIPKSVEEIGQVITLCKRYQYPYYILGNGSNLLVGDKGYSGIMIQLLDNFAGMKAEGNLLKVQAGTLLKDVAEKTIEESLTGFEFASGIPGTMGGAIYMNAGAYGGEMKDIVQEVTVLTKDGEVKKLKKEELEFGYRSSIISKEQSVVLEVVLELAQGVQKEISETIEELTSRREEKQPLEYPSAGSTFKRPEGYFAGKLIDDSGLRGYCFGGAQVSEKHCGFVINKGHATAEDVLGVISHVQEEVYRKFGVMLEPEVRRIGEF